MSLIDHTFGRRAKQAREEAGMSQREVVEAAAALADVRHALSMRTLQRIESAPRQSAKWNKWVSQLKRIFKALR